ncbi:unnamed protein product [Rhizophagus irregularis]|nr:unnamed protein product [Rhizophagus irregularis]
MEYTVMERSLSRFIPLVIFLQKIFLKKIYPFKKLLPNDLVNNILEYHLVPNKKPDNIQLSRCWSSIINSQHFKVFGNWIEKKKIVDYNKVIKSDVYLTSSNYFIVLVENRDSNTTTAEQIVGGYNGIQVRVTSLQKIGLYFHLQIEQSKSRL